ncbi:MAG: 30S ribosomal protein S16 [Bacteroidetes bacterium]|nr:30S ribosomal protein S16 [Bacteroidota bacterium]
MATKIRLQRHGKKAAAFYHIVIADSRSPRDGKFIEKIGTYNPNTNPATIDLQFERALHWLSSGAEPTNTMRAILSYKGVLYKNHLAKGVAKGALTQDAADKKFDAWVNDKTSKITGKAESVVSAKKSAYEKMLSEEKSKNEAKAAKIAAKAVPAAEAAPAAEEAAPAAEGEASAEA